MLILRDLTFVASVSVYRNHPFCRACILTLTFDFLASSSRCLFNFSLCAICLLLSWAKAVLDFFFLRSFNLCFRSLLSLARRAAMSALSLAACAFFFACRRACDRSSKHRHAHVSASCVSMNAIASIRACVLPPQEGACVRVLCYSSDVTPALKSSSACDIRPL